MKVVIADGFHEADYIISLFNTKKNLLLVLNEDEDVCKYLSLNHDIPVMKARCTREGELREAGCEDCDLFITLAEDDYKNYVACRTAKMLLGAKRTIARVSNPKNVAIFQKLDIDSAISSTYLLGEQINNFSSIDNLISTLTLDDNKVFIVELKVTASSDVVGKSLQQINISDMATISSITRGENVIIPNGQTVLEENDAVLIVTTAQNKDKIVKIFQRKKR